MHNKTKPFEYKTKQNKQLKTKENGLEKEKKSNRL